MQEKAHNATQTEVADGDIMDGEAENDTVVIAGQPQVLSTQEMQVCHLSGLLVTIVEVLIAPGRPPKTHWLSDPE